jgi:hypothetical protein
MKKKNVFGGGNANSLYVPMSEVEQEAVARMVESKDLRIVVVGWGHIDQPKVTFGDARLQFVFRLSFDRPEVPVPVYHLDLELRTRSGALLYGSRESVMYDGKPVQVAAGVFFDMVWDIQVRSIDPNLVKALVPGATGLTSRLRDRDTGNLTVEGNMRLSASNRKLLRGLRRAEDRMRLGADKVKK